MNMKFSVLFNNTLINTMLIWLKSDGNSVHVWFFFFFFFSTLISKSLSKIIVYSPLDSIRSTFVEGMRCQGFSTFNLLLWACERLSLSTCRLGNYITSCHLVLLFVHIRSSTGFTQYLSVHLTELKPSAY